MDTHHLRWKKRRTAFNSCELEVNVSGERKSAEREFIIELL